MLISTRGLLFIFFRGNRRIVEEWYWDTYLLAF